MAGIGEAASIIAVVQITGQIAKLCQGYLSEVRRARRDIERLLEKTLDLKTVLDRLSQSGPNSVDPVRLQECHQHVRQLCQRIDPGIKRTTMHKIGLRALKWPLQKEDVDAEVSILEDYLTLFNATIQLDIKDRVDHAERDRLLDKLAFVADAVYNSGENERHRQCLENTRVDVRRQIIQWATADSSQSIFWLRGMAGTGKSTIALTITHELVGTTNSVVASYFFKRGFADMARVRKLLPTLVRQMAHQSSAFCQFLLPVIQSDPVLAQSATMKDQFDKLLIEPLRRLEYSTASTCRFICVLDALDECDDKPEIQRLLEWIANTQDVHKLRLKILVTSRPNISIREGFHRMPRILHHDLALHEVSRAVVDRDIATFFVHELAAVRIRRRLPDHWPGSSEVQCLVSRAAGLFIFASTACLFIGSARHADPQKRLQQVCSITVQDRVATRELDEMYTIALQDSIEPNKYSAEEVEEIALRFRHVVGSVILLSEPLSTFELHRLLCDPVVGSIDAMEAILDPLHAVIDVPSTRERVVRILHLSFRDFLLDQQRCTDLRFWISHEEAHGRLLLASLHLMSQSLYRELCSLSPGTICSDISCDDIDQALVPAVRYACRYWIEHLRLTPKHRLDGGKLHRFLKSHALHWLMAMSIMGKVTEAIQLVTEMTLFATQVDLSPQVAMFAKDFWRFSLSFQHAITCTPYQTYVSALVFSPQKSVMRETFSADMPRWVETRPGVPDLWGACRSTFEGHSGLIGQVLFSPDGQTIASASFDATIRLWNSRTGKCRILKGHKSHVNCIVFSPDGQMVASVAWDSTLRLWKLRTSEVHVLTGHTDRVRTLAFSPDGRTVVSGSEDMTVRMWDVHTGECCGIRNIDFHVAIVAFSPTEQMTVVGACNQTVQLWNWQTSTCRTLNGHLNPVVEVALSPDTQTLASGSSDGEVRLWNVQTGQCRYVLAGHADLIRCLVFSPDGQTLATESDGVTIQLWNVQTGECCNVFEGPFTFPGTVTFSPDGFLVASGCDDNAIRIWNTQNGECYNTLEGHSGKITALNFSPGGQTLVTWSTDRTVRSWDVQSDECCSVLQGHSELVSCVMFSRDGQTAVSTSPDGTVRLWDVFTGNCCGVLKNHSGWINFLSFSPDGQMLASGSSDGPIQLWNVAKGDESLLKFGNHLGRVNVVMFSPDGLTIASGAKDGTVQLWNTQGNCYRLLEGHQGSINAIAFSANGQILASMSNWSVKLWDVPSGKLRHELDNALYLASAVVFSPDGQKVASWSKDTISLWNVHTGANLVRHDTPCPASDVRFSAKGDMIFINATPFALPSQQGGGLERLNVDDSDPIQEFIGLDKEGEWVMVSQRRILWLPPEYRPLVCDVHGDTLVIGTRSGKVFFLRFDLLDPELKAYIAKQDPDRIGSRAIKPYLL